MKSESSAAISSSKEPKMCPRPFLKWVGGKRQLLPELLRRVPQSFGTYYEPFLGGGALYFALNPSRAVLSDLNQELITAYQVVADDVERLIQSLAGHLHDKDYYYALRGADRRPEFKRWGAIRRTSRMLYLNRTCYNGLYRVNSKGLFNVPFGRYSNPRIVDPENLRACAQALGSAQIRCEPFLAVEQQAKKGDFIYFDPPYVPLSGTSNFTSYAKEGFALDDQEALRDLCVRLNKRGVRWMVSNSAAPVVLDLYRQFTIDLVPAVRNINANGSLRGAVDEVIVRNYGGV
jgi:DNA adenine methylase